MKLTWNERLSRERIRHWPKSQAAAADALHVTRETMSRYEAGKVMPGLEVLIRMAELGIDVLYVITGRREAKPSASAQFSLASEAPVRPDTMHVGAPPLGGFTVTRTGGLLVKADGSSPPPLRLPVAFDGGRTTREFQVIPRYKAAASAGKTDEQQAGETMAIDQAGVLAMDRVWMRDQLGSDKPGFVTVVVKGDSMERTLIDGETIIIDSDVNEVDCNGIYVVQVGKALLVKRLVLGMDGGVLVKSDNLAYSAYDREFTAEQAQAIRVIGRMVWPKFR